MKWLGVLQNGLETLSWADLQVGIRCCNSTEGFPGVSIDAVRPPQSALERLELFKSLEVVVTIERWDKAGAPASLSPRPSRLDAAASMLQMWRNIVVALSA